MSKDKKVAIAAFDGYTKGFNEGYHDGKEMVIERVVGFLDAGGTREDLREYLIHSDLER